MTMNGRGGGNVRRERDGERGQRSAACCGRDVDERERGVRGVATLNDVAK